MRSSRRALAAITAAALIVSGLPGEAVAARPAPTNASLEPASLPAPSSSAAGNAPTLAYTGQLLDPSGLYYLRARWYDPGTGRFLTRDPFAGDLVRAPASLNSFAYALANPVLRADPSGRCVPPATVACVALVPVAGPTAIGIWTALNALGAAVLAVAAGAVLLAGGQERADPADAKAPDSQAGDEPADGASHGRRRASEREIRELEKAMGQGIHKAKDDVGAGQGHDIYVDREGGYWVHPKGGRGPGERIW